MLWSAEVVEIDEDIEEEFEQQMCTVAEVLFSDFGKELIHVSNIICILQLIPDTRQFSISIF